LAKVFQALRIAVNRELDVLQEFLMQCTEVLKPGGRLAVISYHSLEDRLVKNFIRSGNFEGKVEQDFYGNKLVNFKAVNRQIITPSEAELTDNSRSRSAKLRIAEKL
jgi:16S rRNA (cytosine1402-N4)-methyltransferase